MTGKIILIGNEKGGTGKTTISVNLAGMAALQSLDVLLVDADPGQQSAAKWAARRQEFHPEAKAIPCVSATGKRLDTVLEDLARRYQVLVVDTGAEDSVEMRATAAVADVFTIPVQAEQFDFWALATMEQIFQRAAALNPKLRCKVVLNRIPYQTVDQAISDATAFMIDNVPALPRDFVPVVGRAAYGRSNAEGLAIHEMPKRDPKASSEMQRLYREVFNHGD
jgi:chromosome partitioning protein